MNKNVTEVGTANAEAQTGSDNQDTLKTTVLPKEEPHHPSLAGEPGIVIPKEKDALSAFEKVEDTDAKVLNENVTEVGTANAEPDSLIAVPSTGVLVEGSELTPKKERNKKRSRNRNTKLERSKELLKLLLAKPIVLVILTLKKLLQSQLLKLKRIIIQRPPLLA